MSTLTTRKLPPFGRDVEWKRRMGFPINLFIFCGTGAWERAQQRIDYYKGDALILPPGEAPERYKWPVKNLDVLMIWPDGDYTSICRFAEILVKQGANKVIAPWIEDKDGYLSF